MEGGEAVGGSRRGLSGWWDWVEDLCGGQEKNGSWLLAAEDERVDWAAAAAAQCRGKRGGTWTFSVVTTV